MRLFDIFNGFPSVLSVLFPKNLKIFPASVQVPHMFFSFVGRPLDLAATMQLCRPVTAGSVS
jgi:hypothetical protein